MRLRPNVALQQTGRLLMERAPRAVLSIALQLSWGVRPQHVIGAMRVPRLSNSAALRAGLVAVLATAGGCQPADVAQCRAAYQRALTAADGAVVDRRSTDAHASITCGTLRAGGKLSAASASRPAG